MSQDVSTNDLMQVMKEGFARMDTKFKEIDVQFAEVIEAINTLSDSTDAQFRQMETNMVTKEYLDHKLFGQKFYLRTV